MFRPIVVALVAICGVGAASINAAAQDPVDPQPLNPRMTAPPSVNSGPVYEIAPSRGLVLPSLYVSFIALEVYDGYSTSQGLKNGASESNTFMASVASHPGALWAAKGAVTFLSIYTAERLWRQHHRGEAIAMMVAMNGIMVAVAASNASVIKQR